MIFEPAGLGPLTLRNRFIHSACEDNLPDENGHVTDELIAKMNSLAQGEVGLIINSHMAVHPLGRSRKTQLAIYDDAMIPGLEKMAAAVRKQGGSIIFQIGHAGIQASKRAIGRAPMGPSAPGSEMSEEDISEVIASFIAAAYRAAEAGAGGIQLHCAHGYLLNEFLSPYFNTRTDRWGVDREGRFRILEEIIAGIQKVIPSDMALMVKLNFNDYTPAEGITPDLAAYYCQRLDELGVHAVEASSGTTGQTPWRMCRGAIPVKDILATVPDDKKDMIKAYLSAIKDECAFEEGYNAQAARAARSALKNAALIVVGGWRNLETMKEALNDGTTDFISLCRPFIKEPDLVKKLKGGESKKASCTSCNRCLIATSRNLPVLCYQKGLPSSD